MSFDPKIGDSVSIHGSKYKFLWNEATAKDLHYVDEREGGEGIVYRVSSQNSTSEYYALKTFHNNLEPNFAKFINDSTSKLSEYKNLHGLRVCDRKLVRSFSDCPESQQHPELKNSVLMPWVLGYTWHDIIAGYQNKKSPINFDGAMCFKLACSIADVLVGLEKNGLAHCDIASGNIIFDISKNLVELIDVEDMYFPNSDEPKKKPLGSEGYKHPYTKGGIWFAEGDRFAGAVLICEILAWSNPQVRKYVDHDTFFSNEELGQFSDKYQVVYEEIKAQYSPELANLFETAWYSDNISSCPSLNNWAEELSHFKQSQTPILHVLPLYLDFGTIENQKASVISISNMGKGVLRGNVSESDNRWLSIQQRAFELNSQEVCDIEIRAFSPSNLEPDSVLVCNITVDSNVGHSDIIASGKVGAKLLPPPVPSSPSTSIGCIIIILVAFVLLICLLIGVANNHPIPTATPIQPIVFAPISTHSATPQKEIPTKTNTPIKIIPSITSKPLLPTVTASPSFFSGGNCSGAPPTRVSINDLVKVVTTNDDRLVLRSEPKLSDSTEKTRLNYGTLLKIHDGPVCVRDPSSGKKYWFWEVKVKSTETMGWVAEGDMQMYYIERVW